jgi:hypothetical protein
MKKIISTVLCTIVLSTAFCQWSPDPLTNITASGYTSSVILTSATSTGGTFISMYKPNGSNFDMVVQYLNAQGVKQFGNDGIILTSYPANSATFVYNVMTDAQDNFIVTFQDQRSASFSAVAYKINTSGQSLWETTPGTGDGLLLGVGLAPYPCQLSTGDYVFAWNNSTNNKIDYMKVTASGTLAWGAALEINPITTGRQISRPQLVAHTGGKWGMVFQQRNGTVGNPLPSTLFEKQFDSDGNTLWTSTALSNYVTATSRYYSVFSLGDVTLSATLPTPTCKTALMVLCSVWMATARCPGVLTAVIFPPSNSIMKWRSTLCIMVCREKCGRWNPLPISTRLPMAFTRNALMPPRVYGN